MEFLKFTLFGLAGLSMIFWTSVMAIWLTNMLPRIFKEDRLIAPVLNDKLPAMLPSQSTLPNRGKYSSQSFVIADFNPVESTYSVNRLYTTMLLSLGCMSFLILIYGLHSGFALYGIY